MSKRYILIDEETGERASINLGSDKLAVLDKHVEQMIELEKTKGWEPVGWTRLHVLATSAAMYGIECIQEKYETPGAATPRESK